MYRGLIGSIFVALAIIALIAWISIGARARRRAERRMHELCSLCDMPTQPDVDLYDSKRRTWCHAACRQRLIGAADIDDRAVVRHGSNQRRQQAC